MLIENNTLIEIHLEDIIDGVFIAPDEVLYISDNFDCKNVVKMILPNVVSIGYNFLGENNTLEYLEMPKVKKIDNNFLYWNDNSKLEIYIPNIKEIGYRFMVNSPNFGYTHRIVKALTGELYIGGEYYDKKEYLRKLNINKILC